MWVAKLGVGPSGTGRGAGAMTSINSRRCYGNGDPLIVARPVHHPTAIEQLTSLASCRPVLITRYFTTSAKIDALATACQTLMVLLRGQRRYRGASHCMSTSPSANNVGLTIKIGSEDARLHVPSYCRRGNARKTCMSAAAKETFYQCCSPDLGIACLSTIAEPS